MRTLLALALIATTLAHDACPVTCDTACREAAVIQGLPRLTPVGHTASPDLSAYDVFHCSPDRGRCSLAKVPKKDFVPTSNPENPASLAVYVTSIGMYALFAVVCAVIVFVAAIVCMCTRCPCCLCSRMNACGGRRPTPKADEDARCLARVCGCGLGTVENADGNQAYPKKSRWMARAFLLVTAVVIAAFVGLGQWQGVMHLKTGLEAVSSSPVDVADILRGLQTPAIASLKAATGSVVRETLSDAATTIKTNADLAAVAADAQCVVDKGSDLPNVDVVLGFVEEVNASVVQINAVRPSVDSTMVQLNATVFRLSAELTTAASQLEAINASIGPVEADLAAVLPPLEDTQALAASLKDRNAGAEAVRERLAVVDDDANYPSPSDVANITTNPALNSTLANLLAGNMDNATVDPDRDQLISKLQAVQGTIQALPNATALSADLTALHTVVEDAAADDVFGRLLGALTAADTSLAAVPPLSDLKNTVATVEALILGVDLDAAEDAVAAINDTVNDFPPTAGIVEELNRLLETVDAIPCLDSLSKQLAHINATLFRVPPSADSVPELVKDLNTTIADKLPIIQDFNDTLATVVTTLEGDASQAVVDFDARVAEFRVQLDDARSVFDNVTADLDTAQVDIDDVDLETVIEDSGELNATLHEPGLGDVSDDAKGLLALGAAVDTLANDLQDAVVAILSFASGRCDGTSGQPAGTRCADSGDCDGGACLFAVRRCVADFTIECPAGTSDPCPAGTDCLFVVEQFTELSAELTAFAENHPRVNGTSLVATLSDIVDSVNSLPDLSSTEADLQSLSSALADIPVASTLSDIASTKADIEDLDVAEITSSVNTVWDAVDDLPDLSSIEQDVEELRGPVADADGYVADVEDLQVAVAGMSYFLDVDVPALGSLLADDTLQGVVAAGGLPALVRYVASTLDSGVAAFNNITVGTKEPFVLDVNVTHLVKGSFRVLDILAGPMTTGPWYFLAELGEVSTVPPSEAGSNGRVFTDADGHSYPGDRLCVTDTCVHNTIVWATTSSVSSVSSSALPLDLNVELVIGLPYIIPLLVVVMALAAVATSFCASSVSKHIACTMASCTFAVLPIFFLVAGAVFFPTAMVTSDVCTSAPNVAYRYASRSPDVLCGGLGLPYDTIGSDPASYDSVCRVHVHNTTVRVHPGDLAGAVLGDCSFAANAAGQSYTDALFDAFTAPLSAMPIHEIDTQLAKLGDGEFAPRAALKDVIVGGGNRAGATVVSSMGSFQASLTCDSLHAGVSTITDAVCCEFFGAVYWAMASWYLITFAMCLCACPSAVFAMKRLRPLKGSDAVSLPDYASLMDGGRPIGYGTAGAAPLPQVGSPRGGAPRGEASPLLTSPTSAVYDTPTQLEIPAQGGTYIAPVYGQSTRV